MGVGAEKHVAHLGPRWFGHREQRLGAQTRGKLLDLEPVHDGVLGQHVRVRDHPRRRVDGLLMHTLQSRHLQSQRPNNTSSPA